MIKKGDLVIYRSAVCRVLGVTTTGVTIRLMICGKVQARTVAANAVTLYKDRTGNTKKEV